MNLAYHHMVLDESVVITELEEKPIYMDVGELQPSPECQQRRRTFIAGRLEQSWPMRILSTDMTFRRKLDMLNCLFSSHLGFTRWIS